MIVKVMGIGHGIVWMAMDTLMPLSGLCHSPEPGRGLWCPAVSVMMLVCGVMLWQGIYIYGMAWRGHGMAWWSVMYWYGS